MFTGIIEEIGKIKSFSKASSGATLVVNCHTVLNGTNIGDSIAINGVCETVTDMTNDSFTVRVSDETLFITTLAESKQNTCVNLERALTPTSRLGGHIVSGHVDCKGKIIEKEQLNDFYNLTFEIPVEQQKYIIHKGSITVNGISLTIAKINNNIFKVAVIPHTFENTNLKTLKIGDFVNIETDILGKYVEKFLSANDNKRKPDKYEFLQENGFV